ncbi:MAG TPA: hypothetical protein VMZ31_19620 [Phycisphaerae bacterium]|nr:hypothetical protein [Phycisphaerae bacterium]
MARASWTCRLGWLIGLVLLAGCQGPISGGYASVALPGVDREGVFEAAAGALRGHGFRIAQADADLWQIQTHPLESMSHGGADRLHEAVVRLPSRVRRIATVYIQKSRSGCQALCQVQLQRLDTTQRDVFARQREFADVPSETPIDRGEGMTTDQTATWTDLRRDRSTERQILQAIRARVTRTPATQAGEP